MQAKPQRPVQSNPAPAPRLSNPSAAHNFCSLDGAVREIATHPDEAGTAGAARPLYLGEFATAGIVRLTNLPLRLHRQPNHEELLIVLEGETDFRVDGDVRRVRRGDFIVVPRNAVHGSMAPEAGPVSYLSIFSPKIDLARDVVWEGEGAPPRYRLV